MTRTMVIIWLGLLFMMQYASMEYQKALSFFQVSDIDVRISRCMAHRLNT